MEVLAGSEVADDVSGGGAERDSGGFRSACHAIERDAERFVLGLVPRQFLPVAGGQRDAVAVVNAAARDLARDRVHSRIVLRPLDAVLVVSVSIARQVVASSETWYRAARASSTRPAHARTAFRRAEGVRRTRMAVLHRPRADR